MCEFDIFGSELRIEGDRIELPETIDRVIPFEDTIIILLDTIGKKNMKNNVWAVSRGGSVKWKIEKARSMDPYTGISMEEGVLRAYNWNGYRYRIDTDTGEITGQKYIK